MAAHHALACAPVLSVALTVAGPPRILTAFHVPGTCQKQEYPEKRRVVKIDDDGHEHSPAGLHQQARAVKALARAGMAARAREALWQVEAA